MKGLVLSESFFIKYGLPMVEKLFPSYKDRIAAGLVGEGSECFGFDDEISQDHDFGPGFCLWLTREDYNSIGYCLQDEYNKLPKEFAGFKGRKETEMGSGRVGVFEIGSYYKKYLGLDHPPTTLRDWFIIPETNLATATNGKVFFDPLGEFSAIRNILLSFYPEDIRLKKIAARCITIAQSGQYNFMRCARRKEYVAVHYAESQFIDAVISLVFLLNKKYKPFYKWMHRGLINLPILGPDIYLLLFQLIESTVDLSNNISKPLLYERKFVIIEEICGLIIKELNKQVLSTSTSDFLLDHAPIIQSKINDQNIKNIPIMAG